MENLDAFYGQAAIPDQPVSAVPVVRFALITYGAATTSISQDGRRAPRTLRNSASALRVI
jgi:hypothetical protein